MSRQWVEDYLKYTELSQAPESYHKWIAFSILAGTVQRKIWVNFSDFTVFPNLYLVLVGPPGRCRKSSAMAVGRDVLSAIGVKLTAESTSREALIDDLQAAEVEFAFSKESAIKHSSLTAFSSEISSLLVIKPVEMIAFLTDIYDCHPIWTHRTRTQGTVILKAPYLNFLGATVPTWLSTYLPAYAVGMGFTSRTIFISEEDRRHNLIYYDLDLAHKDLRASLLTQLKEIAKLSGIMTLTEDAKSFYKDWYENKLDVTYDERVAGYYERKHLHVMKIAIALSISESNSLIIEVHHLEKAIDELTKLEPDMKRLFTGIGENKLAVYLERIANQIRLKKVVAYSKLLQENFHHVNTEQFDEIVNILRLTHQVRVNVDGTSGAKMLEWVGRRKTSNEEKG